MNAETPRIQDYALIGNGRSAALVSNRGSIDWLAWPRFDSASIFAAIIDPALGGAWSIRPVEPAEVERHYLENTNVLVTRFSTGSGRILLTDFMPVASEEQKEQLLWPEHELVRRVECEQGAAQVRVRFDPRPDYGRVVPVIKNAGQLGLRIDIGASLLALRSDVALNQMIEGDFSTDVVLEAGEAVTFSLTFSAEGPAVLPPLGDLAVKKLDLTIDWWRRWTEQATYRGPYQEQVIRSALVLKLLSYAPSGAIVAAPTTSLPESIGGDLNWDYRFAWLRDAAFTVHALFDLGYHDDAEAFVSWLLHATRLTRPELRVVYDVFGERPHEERILSHLSGYADSRPARLGNAASGQVQLDIYGEVVEAVSYFLGEKKRPDREMQKLLRQCGEYVCRNWHEPDSGMWEIRGERQHFTHSRLLCWVALDRLLEMQARGQLDGIRIEEFREIRARLRTDIEERAWNPKLEAYTQTLGGHTLDANVLLLALHDFEDASSARMQKTHQRIREKLAPSPGLVHRNEQSLERGEGAFAICSFWEVGFLARGGGTLSEAQRVFRAALDHANDVGLFAEEIDAETGDALGNFPQAFTHLGLINAALSLRDREEREKANVEIDRSGGEHQRG